MNYDQLENIGILAEVKEFEKIASVESISQLQADILYKRNWGNILSYPKIVRFTAQDLCCATLKNFKNTPFLGLLAVFAYGIEEGKRMERARRKGGASK